MTGSKRFPVAMAAAFAATFVLGLAAGAWAKKDTVTPALYTGKTPQDAAASLLDAAKVLAEKGSWENIGIGRVYYLGKQKAAGQAIFDSITNGKKAEAGDWMRIGRTYREAGEWDKARVAFDKVLQLKPDDEDWQAEIGAYYLLKGDRARAEQLFTQSFQREPNNMWNALRAAGAYMGVPPQDY